MNQKYTIAVRPNGYVILDPSGNPVEYSHKGDKNLRALQSRKDWYNKYYML